MSRPKGSKNRKTIIREKFADYTAKRIIERLDIKKKLTKAGK